MPMEAWLHGAATTAQVSPVLKNLLDGLASVPPAPVYERLLCLASPPSSTGSRSEVHLIRDLTSPHSTWRVRNQARPLTGDKADKLGAVVREVQEAATHSGDAYSLFTALGFTIEYHFSRKGSRYTLLMQNQPVTVHMVYLEVPRPDGSIAPIVPDTWLVEASCLTTQEAYSDACAALVALKSTLAHAVELKKPATHLARPNDPAGQPKKTMLGLKHVLGASA